MNESIVQISKSQQNYTLALRLKLHAAPELSFQERGTSELVREALEKLNIPGTPVRGRACVNFAHVGFVAACRGGSIGIARWET